MGKLMHTQVHSDKKTTGNGRSAAIVERLNGVLKRYPIAFWSDAFAVLFFIVVWALLAFRESALLFRVNELSVFLYDNLFYEEMLSVPAGVLYYVASWLVQFFYYPALGASVYVLLLALVYWLIIKVFDIKSKFRLLALLPVVALLASNTQLGYWIFYIKIPGYYYVALLGVIFSLLAIWAVKKSHIYLKPLLVVAWIYFAYPCLGVYAVASGVIMGVHTLCRAIGGKRSGAGLAVASATMLAAVAAAYFAPPMYYKRYTTVPLEEVYTVGLPASQWKSKNVPNKSEKIKELSIIADINGRVGYPQSRALTKFKLNIDGSFSQKAIKIAKDELFAINEINCPQDGKLYTFAFVGKDGSEFYLDATAGRVSFVEKKQGASIPKTGHFVCVADKNEKSITQFRTQDGLFLVWNKDEATGACSVGLSSSPTAGNSRCLVQKLKKEGAVEAADNSELFGLVKLLILNNKSAGGAEPLFVAGFADGALAGSQDAIFNDAHTSALRVEEVGFKPLPFSLELQKRSWWFNVGIYWVPFYLLLLSFIVLAVWSAFPLNKLNDEPGLSQCAMLLLAALVLVCFTSLFWYDNDNFRIENEQNRAMWNEDWKEVAELSRDAEIPTRQVVMNKNIALLKTGRSGNEMFAYPEGSADIETSIPVRLAQTGGKMAYFQYGKFNFCYRWCVEDAVEYGWRIEYLKHAVRSMLLSGEYRLAERYINILKRTMFYDEWACEMEKYLHNPELITRNREFAVPLAMTTYDDYLDVDESYVEAYLTRNLTNATDKMSRFYVEAALASALTRKDASTFWAFLNYYVNELKVGSLPKHYQEAVLLFLNVDRGRTVQVPKAFIEKYISMSTNNKLTRFMNVVSEHKGMSEEQMAPYFEEEFKDTYFYFYFFVRNIKTN